MKKLSKTLTAIVMIIAMVVVMVIPASGVTGGYKWANFTPIYYGYNNNDYVRFAQSYLYRFNSTVHDLWSNTSSVIDGQYGNITRNAAIAFQTFVKNYYYSDMVIDGQIGPQTWGKMADFAVDNNTSSYNGISYYVFKIGTTSYAYNPGYGNVGARLPSGSTNIAWYYNFSIDPYITVPCLFATN